MWTAAAVRMASKRLVRRPPHRSFSNAYDLTGRKAVITGGAQGIGFAVAERLLKSGASSVTPAPATHGEGGRRKAWDGGQVGSWTSRGGGGTYILLDYIDLDIHTYTHTSYIHTYIRTYILTYLHTYILDGARS